jgi:hypothetical protein
VKTNARPSSHDEVAVGAGWPENETFEAQAAQVVGHVSAGVIAAGDAKQVGNQDPQVAIMEAIDQVLKQGQCQEQGHDSGLAELQCRRLLTVFGNGRLHHALDAVAAQPTVVADAFDLQQAPVDLTADFLQVGQIG